MKPTVKLTDTDGNVFALAGKVRQALRRAGQDKEAKEFGEKLWKCGSYEQALKLMADYVEIE